MSVGSFVLTGIGGGSTVALFITEGYGVQGAAPPANVVLGGIPKRRGKRFEITINDQKFVAPSVYALEALVLAWRKAHPANDKGIEAPKPKPIPAPHQPVRETVVLPDEGATQPSGPERRETRGTTVSHETFAEEAAAAQAVLQAEMARRVQEEATTRAELKRRQEEEEDDLEALMAILRVAA